MKLLDRLVAESEGMAILEFGAGKGILGRLVQALRGNEYGLVQLDHKDNIKSWTTGGHPLPSVSLKDITASNVDTMVSRHEVGMLLVSFPPPSADPTSAVFKALAESTKAQKVCLIGIEGGVRTCDAAMKRALLSSSFILASSSFTVSSAPVQNPMEIDSWFPSELRTATSSVKTPTGTDVNLSFYVNAKSRPKRKRG